MENESSMQLSVEELELFELAFLLKIPLYKMLEEMPYIELLGWQSYLKRRPYGWREDYRAAVIASAQGAKLKTDEIFPSLVAIRERPADKLNIQNSVFGRLVQSSVGGKRLEF